MRDDLSPNNPKSIWQGQPTEPSTMNLEQIRRKVEALRAKTRRELLKNIAVPLNVAVILGLGVWMPHTAAELKVLALALIWSLAGQYFLHRGMWVTTLPGDTAGLASYRQEIERRHRILRNDLQWSFAPLFLAIGALILPNLSPKMLPFLSALLVWGVLVVAQRIRRQREFRKEIGALSEIERLNS